MIREQKAGFTLIELVIVIVILGILASLALPKFVDIVTDAKMSATKGGLGALRAVVALKYSKTIVGGGTTLPSTIDATDFFDGKLPVNKLNDQSIINLTAAAVTGDTVTSASGWWYVTGTGTAAGQAGAYSDGTVTVSNW